MKVSEMELLMHCRDRFFNGVAGASFYRVSAPMPFQVLASPANLVSMMEAVLTGRSILQSGNRRADVGRMLMCLALAWMTLTTLVG